MLLFSFRRSHQDSRGGRGGNTKEAKDAKGEAAVSPIPRGEAEIILFSAFRTECFNHPPHVGGYDHVHHGGGWKPPKPAGEDAYATTTPRAKVSLFIQRDYD